MGKIKNLIKTYFVMLIVRISYIFLPIAKNRIVFWCYSGRQFSCSPKCIYEYLVKKYKDKFEYAWVVNNPDGTVILPPNVLPLKKGSFRYYYYNLTAKVIVCNSGASMTMPPRKGSFFIQTWHGVAYKRIRMTRLKKFSAFIVHTMWLKVRKVSFYLSGCRNFSEMFSKAFPISQSKALECGMPRNDIFFGDYSDVIAKVREYYKIPQNKKIVLYAPTFKWNDNHGKISFSSSEKINIERCLETLNKRFSKDFVFLFRAHYYIENEVMDGCVDASDYPDMQELLCAADVLITDYSSSIWDYSLMGKPCFLYAPDLDEYDRKQGFYVPIEGWPGILSLDNESLVKNIESFDEEAFAERIKRHHETMGICETGRASQIVGDKIYEMCFENKIRKGV